MTHIRQRAATEASWAAKNPVLLLGEVGWTIPEGKAKIGDGVKTWSQLTYAIGNQGLKGDPGSKGDPGAAGDQVTLADTGDGGTNLTTTRSGTSKTVKFVNYAKIAEKMDVIASNIALRQAMSTMITESSTLLRSVGGMLGSGLVASRTSDTTVDVSPGRMWSSVSLGGVYGYLASFEAVTTLTFAVRSANARTDLITVKGVPNDTTGLVDCSLVVIQGASGGGLPAVPAGSQAIWAVPVPAAGSAGTGIGNPVDARPPRVAMRGGVSQVASRAAAEASTALYDGLIVYRQDINAFEARSNGAWGPVKTPVPFVDVRATAVQSMATGASTPISFSSLVGTDPFGMWDSSTPTVVTCKVDGLYQIVITASWASASGGSRIFQIFVNGAVVKSGALNILGVAHSSTQTFYTRLAAGDKVGYSLFQSSGAAINTHNQDYPRLQVAYQGA